MVRESGLGGFAGKDVFGFVCRLHPMLQVLYMIVESDVHTPCYEGRKVFSSGRDFLLMILREEDDVLIGMFRGPWGCSHRYPASEVNSAFVGDHVEGGVNVAGV